MFWIGPGVINIKGRDFKYGDKLPQSMSDDALKSLKKKKLVAEKVPTVKEFKQVSESALKKELAEVTGELAEVTAKLEAAEQTIGELTKQITAPGQKKNGKQ